MDNLWDRFSTAVRARYRGTALASYGAGLHLDCEDCATAPSDVPVPAPRRRATAPVVPAAHGAGTVGTAR